MKRTILLILILLFAHGILCLSQGTWVQKVNFIGTERVHAVGFSIGNKGYMGLGEVFTTFTWTCYKDFWEYDPASNVWTQKAAFPGPTRIAAVGFSIGAKGYVGTGATTDTWTFYRDFWEYDPVANSWSQKADFIGARAFAVGFSIGSKGYIGTGLSDTLTSNADFWEYDVPSDTWTKKSDFQGGLRESAIGFSIKQKGYVGCGGDGINVYQDFWEWDQGTGVWSQKANFAGVARKGAIGFSIGNFGYVGTGDTSYNAGSSSLSDFWQYNSSTNTWAQMGNYGGGDREYAAAFVIGCQGYVGTGGIDANTGYVYNEDFWEFTHPLSPSISPVTNVDCFGNNTASASANINGTPSYTYLWSGIPIQTTQTASGLYAGSYTVTVIDSVGCIYSDSVTITSPTGLTALPSAITDPVCFGTNTGTASASAAGGTPGYTYSWSPTGQTNANATGLGLGIYTVTITDNNGCIVSTLVQLTQQPTPVIANISPDVSICPGASTTRTITASGGTPGYTYLWMPPVATTASIYVSPSATTTYTAEVTDANGCSAPLLITTVTVGQNPSATVTYTAGACAALVQFTDSSTNAVAWDWDFGDGGTSAVQHPSHGYSAIGSYLVILTLTNPLGCKTTDQFMVDVPEFSELFIPNAFSPNDDSNNDTYFISGSCIDEMDLTIFNRWGEKVFETSDQTQSWDGAFKGEKQNAGVYMYSFKGKLSTGETVDKKGNITLMR